MESCLFLQCIIKTQIEVSAITQDENNSPAPEVYKTFFMLNSTEHEIYHAHKC